MGSLAHERCRIWVQQGWNVPNADGLDELALVHSADGSGQGVSAPYCTRTGAGAAMTSFSSYRCTDVLKPGCQESSCIF